MFARVACRKATGPTRKMSSFLQRINSIGELRKNFYSKPEVGIDNPTYLKGPQDNIFIPALGAFVVTGVLGLSYGMTHLALK